MNFLASIRGANEAPYPGWLTHDGFAMPVAPESQPGVAFRNGWRVPPGHYAASHWLEFGGDFWCHDGRPLDIVAFLPSYRSATVSRWRLAVCSLIEERFGCDAGEVVNERLADDIIALMNLRGPSEADATLRLIGNVASLNR